MDKDTQKELFEKVNSYFYGDRSVSKPALINWVEEYKKDEDEEVYKRAYTEYRWLLEPLGITLDDLLTNTL